VKLFVTSRAVRSPAPRRRLSRDSTGTPHAVAFLRGDVLVIVPRLTASLVKPPQLPGDVWGDDALNLSGRWRSVFTEETLESLELRNVFASFPVAILERA
jgi:maltooligosyltrehalose synthase